MYLDYSVQTEKRRARSTQACKEKILGKSEYRHASRLSHRLDCISIIVYRPKSNERELTKRVRGKLEEIRVACHASRMSHSVLLCSPNTSPTRSSYLIGVRHVADVVIFLFSVNFCVSSPKGALNLSNLSHANPMGALRWRWQVLDVRYDRGSTFRLKLFLNDWAP